MTAEPSLIWKGTVDVTSEPFEFPFESPPGGCLLRYKFEVQDGYELAFMLRQGAPSLLAKSGDGSQGEIEVAGEGMCSVRWENEGYISFTARQVSYEAAPVPAAMNTRETRWYYVLYVLKFILRVLSAVTGSTTP